jgi:septal ring factor EnvC (AmiA/AmiB activator)
MTQTNEVQIFEPITNTQLIAVEVFTGKDGVTKLLSGIEAELAKFVPDTTTAKGRKEIASMAYKCSQSKTLLDGLGKDLVSGWKAQSALVDASRKIARDRLDELRDQTRKPLDEWEAEEEKRLSAEKLALEIEAAHDAAIIENDLFNRGREIARKEAELAKIEEERVAKEEAELANKLMKEQIEREEAARIANEERIRKEATEKAQKEEAERAAAQIAEAERKEREAKEALELAELRRIADAKQAEENRLAAIAEEQRKAAVEAARVESERKSKEVAESARIEAERKEAERKAVDVEHRRTVNTEIVAGLVAAGLTESQAKKVITAIVGGLVNHVRINY